MSFNVYQQVFSLSIASNLVNDLKGKQVALQQTLQFILKDIALPMIGGWELVFGPVVWKNKPDEETTGPDNSWYVAYHPALQLEDGTVAPTYVISVAGTPVQSQYAWFEENFAVNTVSDFKTWVANGLVSEPKPVKAKDVVVGNAYIAIGTVKAVHLLLNTRAPEGAISAGANLLDFIASIPNSKDCRFIATGHSLGGALSPSIALALAQAGVIPANRTLTYPTAGPSPGNQGFTDLFIQTFPPIGSGEEGSYKGWNRNILNRLDIVPQAWCAKKYASPDQNLGNIPTIYGAPAVPIVLGITILFAAHVLRAGVLYKPLPSQFFRGPPPQARPETLDQFVKVLGPQHIAAYAEFFGIPIPTHNKKGLNAGLHEKNEAELRLNYPVIADYEWALEHPKETEEELGKHKAAAQGEQYFETRD